MTIVNYILEGLENTTNTINKHYKIIIDVLFIFMTYFCIEFSGLQDHMFIVWMCVYVAMEIAKSFITYVKQKNAEDEKDKFPMMNKRFTKKYGTEITVKKGDLQQAMIYLSMLEDYRERNYGKYD